jgi:polysaccharide export outer membrane protein
MIFNQVSSQGPTLSDEGGTKVYIWGEVRSPGVYNLTSSPDLVELISTAGGPTSSADLTRVKVVRGIERKVVWFDMKRSMGRGELFFLMPGDVVMVPTSFWSKTVNLIQAVTTLAVLFNLYISVRSFYKR